MKNVAAVRRPKVVTRDLASIAFPQSFLSVLDLSAEALEHLLDVATAMKRDRAAGRAGNQPLAGQHVAMLFEKPSLRTRTTFVIAVRELGGDVIEPPSEVVFGGRETVEDVARNLERWVSGVVVRTFEQERVVAERRLDPVPDGVPEVQEHARTTLGLVGRHDPRLQPDRHADRADRGLRISGEEERCVPLERGDRVLAVEPRALHDLREPGDAFGVRERGERVLHSPLGGDVHDRAGHALGASGAVTPDSPPAAEPALGLLRREHPVLHREILRA